MVLFKYNKKGSRYTFSGYSRENNNILYARRAKERSNLPSVCILYRRSTEYKNKSFKRRTHTHDRGVIIIAARRVNNNCISSESQNAASTPKYKGKDSRARNNNVAYCRESLLLRYIRISGELNFLFSFF